MGLLPPNLAGVNGAEQAPCRAFVAQRADLAMDGEGSLAQLRCLIQVSGDIVKVAETGEHDRRVAAISYLLQYGERALIILLSWL